MRYRNDKPPSARLRCSCGARNVDDSHRCEDDWVDGLVDTAMVVAHGAMKIVLIATVVYMMMR